LPPDSQSRKPERVEVSIGQRNLKGRAIRQPPRTVSAARRLGGEFFAHSPLPQFGESHRSPIPLLPQHRPHPAPGPRLKPLQHRGCLTLAEIADPAAKITAQLLGHLLHVHAPRPSRHFPDFRFEPEHRFRRNPPLWFPIRRETEAQKLPLPWPRHRTLLLVYLELELRRDESCDAPHHSLPGPPAANVHVTVVRISREPKTSPLQLPVELVEYDITEQG